MKNNPYNILIQPHKDGSFLLVRQGNCPGYCGYVAFPSKQFTETGYGGILSYVPVHGGITYHEIEEGWYVYGFDCNHADDYTNPHWQDLNNVLAECENLHEALVLAKDYEADYLLNKDSEYRAEVIDSYHKQCRKQGLTFNLNDNFGALLNLLSGQL